MIFLIKLYSMINKELSLFKKISYFTLIFFINILIYDYNHLFQYSMYAETATNYVANLNKSFFEYLFTNDFGYFALIPRIIGFFINVFHIKYKDIPIYFFISSRIIIFLTLAFTLRFKFEKLFNYKILNVELYASILILFAINYEMKFINNVVYIGYYYIVLFFIHVFYIF